MSQYICDICSRQMDRSLIKFHSAATIKQAVRAGLNPWKTPGIDMSINANLGAVFGLSTDEQYYGWRERALADTTDWGLCPSCTQVISRMVHPPETPKKSTTGQGTAVSNQAAVKTPGPQKSTAKKWWQFWK